MDFEDKFDQMSKWALALKQGMKVCTTHIILSIRRICRLNEEMDHLGLSAEQQQRVKVVLDDVCFSSKSMLEALLYKVGQLDMETKEIGSSSHFIWVASKT